GLALVVGNFHYLLKHLHIAHALLLLPDPVIPVLLGGAAPDGSRRFREALQNMVRHRIGRIRNAGAAFVYPESGGLVFLIGAHPYPLSAPSESRISTEGLIKRPSAYESAF